MTTATIATIARTMAQVKALFPECFTLSIVDAVAAATDKGAAVDLIARAIVGAALEYGHSGSDSRLKSARDSLLGKGKGVQVRARAVLAIDAIKGEIKPRALTALDDGAIVDWVLNAMAQAVDALTPAPVARKTPTAKTAPEASVTAPEAGVTAPEALDIILAIQAGAYDVESLHNIAEAIALTLGDKGAAKGAAPALA